MGGGRVGMQPPFELLPYPMLGLFGHFQRHREGRAGFAILAQLGCALLAAFAQMVLDYDFLVSSSRSSAASGSKSLMS